MAYSTSKYFSATLKNGSNSNMAVNGSSAPVPFTLVKPSAQDVRIGAISIIAECSGLAFGNKFIESTITALTNGLLFEAKADDVPIVWQTAKRTRDLIEIAAPGGVVLVSGSPSLFKVDLWLPENLKFIKAGIFTSDDYFRVTVRDDLRNLHFLEVALQGVKL